MKIKETRESFELLSTFNRVESTHWWWEGRRYLIKQLLKDTNPKKILDIGCGTGETLTYLHTLFPRADLFGIDTSGDAVLYSHKRGHKNVLAANALSLPYSSNTFDTVLFLDVLEHIKDEKKALLEARRVLKSTGMILITSPALPFLWSDHDKNQGHFRRYTKRDLIELSVETKLKILKVRYFNFILSPIVLVIRLLGKLPFLHFVVAYDNGINYEVVNHRFINAVLTSIFKFEIWLMTKGLRYPFGISIACVYEKNS
jgi:ubiquinone/menaquinone biosynthesis C-methylase UbiE